jgi:signal transduction histidine kinase/ActR/RegA family two-component response regulator
MWRRGWLAVGLLLCWLHGFAASLPIPPDPAPLRVGRALDVAEDATGNWSLADAMANGAAFVRVPDGKFSAGISRSVWWFRIEFDNGDDGRVRRLLRVDPPRLEQVTAYVPDPAAVDIDVRRAHVEMPGWWALRNGMAVPVSERITPDRAHNFPLSLPYGKTTIYLRVENRGRISVQPSLLTPDRAFDQDRVQDLGMMTIFGGLAVLAIAALLIAVMAQEKIIACYGLLILFYLLYEMGVQGYGSIFLWSGTPQPSLLFFNAASLAQMMCGLQLLQLAVQSRRLSRKAHWLLNLCKFATIALLLSMPVLPVHTVVSLGLNLSLVVLVVFVGCLVFFAWKKSVAARTLLWSLLPVIVISAVRVGEFMGWYLLGGFAELLLPMGYLATMLFMATLVTNRLRLAQAERLNQQADSLMQAAYAQEALERAIGARTGELRVAKERAERADLAKGHFLARMGHELRTPLHAILGYVQLLRRQRRADVALQTPLAIMEDSGRHLLDLINDVLDYSRGELASLSLRPAPTYLFSLLRAVVDQIGRSEPDQLDRIRLHVDADLPRVIRVDGQRLRQVLLNLLGNAVRHGGDGAIDLRARRTWENGTPLLHLEVCDEGPGIAQADHERIFEPFSHDPSSPTTTGGVGLGLTISRQLVRLMQGELSVTSAPGEGSRFHFSIPLETAAEADVPRDRAAAPVGRYLGPTQHILVVDDVRDNQRFLADLLGDAGFEVTIAANCDEARSALRMGGIDAALFDQFLPDGSGWSLLRDSRTSAPGMPALLLSAAPPLPPADWGDEPGFAACLLKPIDVDTLFAALSDALGLIWPTDEPDPNEAVEPAESDDTHDPASARTRLAAAVADGDIFAIEAWVAQHRDGGDAALSALARALVPAVEAMDMKAMRAIVDASASLSSPRAIGQ